MKTKTESVLISLVNAPLTSAELRAHARVMFQHWSDEGTDRSHLAYQLASGDADRAERYDRAMDALESAAYMLRTARRAEHAARMRHADRGTERTYKAVHRAELRTEEARVMLHNRALELSAAAAADPRVWFNQQADSWRQYAKTQRQIMEASLNARNKAEPIAGSPAAVPEALESIYLRVLEDTADLGKAWDATMTAAHAQHSDPGTAYLATIAAGRYIRDSRPALFEYAREQRDVDPDAPRSADIALLDTDTPALADRAALDAYDESKTKGSSDVDAWHAADDAAHAITGSSMTSTRAADAAHATTGRPPLTSPAGPIPMVTPAGIQYMEPCPGCELEQANAADVDRFCPSCRMIVDSRTQDTATTEDDINLLLGTLARINVHYGAGGIIEHDYAGSRVLVKKQFGAPQWVKYRREGNRVTFRGTTRSLHYGQHYTNVLPRNAPTPAACARCGTTEETLTIWDHTLCRRCRQSANQDAGTPDS